MCGPGGELHPDSDRASHRLYAEDPLRRRLIDQTIAAYLSTQTAVEAGGQFWAIATAGVPGAGKSTSIRRHPDIDERWRTLDADRVKEYLIQAALQDGDYTDLLSIDLPDGGTVMPRELASLVHFESIKILDELQEICMSRGENIILEGTFSWTGLADHLLRSLGGHGYRRLTIMDVEVTCAQAQQRAVGRWWKGRTSDPLGGRFVPAATIAAMYPNGSAESICAKNARAAFHNSLTSEIDTVELFVDDHTGTEPVDRVFTKSGGTLNYASDPSYLDS